MDNIDSIDLGPAAQRLAHLVARVTDDELGKPTPCPAYTVGDLAGRVGELALAFTAAAEKESNKYNDREPPPGDASRLGDDWRTRIPRDLAAMAQAWRDPEAWTGMTVIAGSESPASVVGLVAADELVVHGWDVARATGQPYDPEPEVLDAAKSFLMMFASPDAAAGPEVAVRAFPGDARRRAAARPRGRAGRPGPWLVTQLRWIRTGRGGGSCAGRLPGRSPRTRSPRGR